MNKSTPPSVLVVNNDDRNLRNYKYVLEEYYKVYTAKTAQEALDLLSSGIPINIILSSGYFGKGQPGGVKIVRKTLDMNIPVIAISGDDSLNKEMKKAGAVGSQTEYDLSELLTLMENILDNKDNNTNG